MLQNYVPFVGFISNLIDKLDALDTDLPIHEQHIAILKSRLGNTGYTFLYIKDGYNTEVVKVSNIAGDLMISRGLETTTAATMPKGSVVYWELTPTAVADIVCQMPCCPE